MKIVNMIQLDIVIITAVKSRCILHGRVFVMSQERRDVQEKQICIIKDNWKVLKLDITSIGTITFVR